MKHLLRIFHRARTFLFVLGVLGLTIAAVSTWRSSALRTDKEAEGKRQYHAQIRDGVGREVQFASPGDSPGAVRSSVNSVDKFISGRSGIKLSGQTKTRLAEMEQQVLIGAGKRLKTSALIDILTETAFERLETLTDEEILHIDDTLRGFNAPDLPRRLNRGAILLPGSIVFISKDKFVEQLKAMRDQTSTPLGPVLKAAARREIQTVLHRRIGDFSEAVPEKFAGVWDVAGQSDGDLGVTPLQSILIAYSVASSDLMTYSEANLTKYMAELQRARIKRWGENFPGPQGHHAFGVNGYLVSTPLNLVLDEQTVNRMLDRIHERSAK